MTDLDYFPPSFLNPEAKDQVIAWLATLPLPLPTKKSVLDLWRKTYNVTLTAEDWHKATGETYQ